MRRSNLFWGLILIILGGLFFLQANGVIKDVLGWFWPLALILLGIWVLSWPFLPGSMGLGKSFSLDLQGAARVDLDLDHGAGSLSLRADAPAGKAISGPSGTTLDVNQHLQGDRLAVELKAGPTFIPFLGPEGGQWQFSITREVPVAINIEGGASSLDLDLTDAKLTCLGLHTGASKVKVVLPNGAGNSLVDIDAGAASLDLTVPEGVGARIRVEHGASAINIDEKRFHKLTSMQNLYESEGFDSCQNKVEIKMQGGASSLAVR